MTLFVDSQHVCKTKKKHHSLTVERILYANWYGTAQNVCVICSIFITTVLYHNNYHRYSSYTTTYYRVYEPRWYTNGRWLRVGPHSSAVSKRQADSLGYRSKAALIRGASSELSPLQTERVDARRRGLLASNVCIFTQLSITSFSVTSLHCQWRH